MSREKSDLTNCISLEDMHSVVEYLSETQGNIMLTTGSKNFIYSLIVYKDRIYPRILPFEQSLVECKNTGIPASNIVAMQGPFDYDLNLALFKGLNIKVLVTKDSGKNGGFLEKIKAANDLNIQIILIKRPEEKTGFSLSQTKEMLLKKFNLTKKQNVYIIGTGVGNPNISTLEATKIIHSCDLIIGSRLLEETDNIQNKPTLCEFYPDKIIDYISKNKQFRNISVLFSGDIVFYSGATKLFENLSNNSDINVIPICGISSVVYLSSKIKTTWQDIKLTSLHGRTNNIIADIISNNKVFTLLGGDTNIKELCDLLLKYSLNNVQIFVGENLSYHNEKIIFGSPSELIDLDISHLSCAIIINENYDTSLKIGIQDEQFTRKERIPDKIRGSCYCSF